MDFYYGTNTWFSVHGNRMENRRYYNAYCASYVYLLDSLKKMKILQ